MKGKSFRKEGRASTAHDPDHCLLEFGYEREAFRVGTRVHSSQPGRLEGDDLIWDLRLDPRGEWHTGVEVLVDVEEEIKEPTHETFGDPERQAGRLLQRWRDEVPRLEAGADLVRHVYEKSIVDLAALRLGAEVEGNEFSLPAAGLPWFMTIFGRDTLITAYQAIWVGPELARGALLTLASFQGKEMNDFKDEEPGKILHEIRFGELSRLGLKPHRPYYGSADSTPLWLVLLSEYWRWTADRETVRALEPNARRALEWIDRYGDLDGDGYIEYRTRSSEGLRTQGWKDSWNGVLFADGSLPEPPIALCEIQGYAYDAKVRAAELADEVWEAPDLAARLRTEAAQLLDRFNADFWSETRGGYYAIGLDRDKRPIDSMTSNMGHLLWSGIVAPERARTVAGQLFTEGMFSGWGVRTMSSEDAGYSPIGYHIGTIWPHDNSLISAGLARYGLREEANRIAAAMFEAAGFTDYRLPEVFAGYSRREGAFPVRYPTASSPQAWASAAPFLWLRLLLGIEPRDGELTSDPAVPEGMGPLVLSGIHAFGGRYDVEGEGTSGGVTRRPVG